MQLTKKIIHIITDLGNGGAERQLIELLKKNPSQKLLIFKSAGIYKKELDIHKIKYKELNIKNNFSIFLNLLKISEEIKSSRPLIIHAWMYNACLIMSLVKLLFNLKNSLVWGIRCSNMDLTHYSLSLRLTFNLCRIFSFMANYIIYNSYSGQIYHRRLGFYSKLNKVILNGIDNKKFIFSNKKHIEIRKSLGIKKNEVVIICAARLDPMKNHINLLKAFQKIRKKNKKIILLLIGKGTENLKSQEGVMAIGMKVDIENYYSVGDMIIMPSKFGEGFPNALAEGMSCKLFPITTNVGDAIKIVSNIGLVIKNTNANAISASLNTALKFSKIKINNLKGLSRNRVVKDYNIKKMSNEYNKCYEELI